MVHAITLYAPAWDVCLLVRRSGWVLEHGVLRVDPGKGWLLAKKRQSEGTGVRSSTTGKVCGRSPSQHRSRAILLSGAQGAGSPLQTTSPTTGPFCVNTQTHLWGMDKVRIWAASIAPTVGTSTQLLQSWDWLCQICAGSLVKTVPDRHQGQLLAYPWLRWVWEQFQQECNLRASTIGKKWHNRVHSQLEVNNSRGGKLSGFSPTKSAPVLPTSHWGSETQLRNRSGCVYSNN